MEFSQIARLAAEHGRPLGAVVAPDRWVSERLARHGVADGGHVQALADGRWVQINELRTSEGGIVGIYTDITEVKAEDARARARELGERNLILQSTLDTLSEGVCMFDSSGRLSAWNGALGRLLGLGDDPTRALANHDDLLDWCRRGLNMDDQGCLDWQDDGMASPVSQLCLAGERRFEVRSTRTGQGGLVFSFTDVTDMLDRAGGPARNRRDAGAAGVGTHRRTDERERASGAGGGRTAHHRGGSDPGQDRGGKGQSVQDQLSGGGQSRSVAAPERGLPVRCGAGRPALALPTRALVSQTATALESVEDLLEALLEISRLDAGAIQPEISHFRIDQLLATLNVEFTPWRAPGAVAADRNGRNLGPVGCAAAAPYSAEFHLQCHPLHRRGRGARHLRGGGDQVKVAVIDTGRGIAVSQQALIFEEFRRLDTRSQGKGLGLAIVRRAADMLGHKILLHSAPGEGATLPSPCRWAARPRARKRQHRTPRDRTMQGLRVLVVDNERQIQSGMRTCWADGDAMWRWRRMRGSAAAVRQGERPDVILADYHLNDGETGDRVIARLQDHFGAAVPSVMISADRGEGLKARLAAAGRPC
jgi:PAS domain-containing protein/CheY-like chemotaxis protein